MRLPIDNFKLSQTKGTKYSLNDQQPKITKDAVKR